VQARIAEALAHGRISIRCLTKFLVIALRHILVHARSLWIAAILILARIHIPAVALAIIPVSTLVIIPVSTLVQIITIPVTAVITQVRLG